MFASAYVFNVLRLAYIHMAEGLASMKKRNLDLKM